NAEWNLFDLASAGGDTWQGSVVPLNGTIEYFVQAVDLLGNVTLKTNYGDPFTVEGPIAPASKVYVSPYWSGFALNSDPDGAGPATKMGYDAFSDIQSAVNGVAASGTVVVYSGTYSANISVSKSVTLTGKGDVTLLGSGSGDGFNVSAG